MAIKCAIASGNFNTAGTWHTGTETDSGNTSGITFTSTRYTNTFTAPNTTNACKGVIVSMYNLSLTTSTLNATLQEYNGSAWNDCAGATVSIDEANLRPFAFTSTGVTCPMFLYFEFGTSYTYTTTSAGYYRVKIWRTVSGGSTAFYAGGTVTTAVWGVVVDDRNGVPASTDTCYIVGGSTKTTVTLDGACSCGPTVASDGTSYFAMTPNLSANWAMLIGYNGQVIPDTTQNSTLTINGSSPIIVAGGQLNFGTASVPHTASYTAKILFVPKTSYANGIGVYGYNTSLEQFSMVGQTKTYKTTYSSGAGTTASPLVVTDATGWSVNDIIVVSADTYNKYEAKYIKTIAGTSITLADSAGGAESGLANTHYNTDWVLNLTRNVSMGTGGSNKWWFGYLNITSTTCGVMKYASFDHVGGNASSRYTIYAASNARHAVNVEGCSFYDLGNTTTLNQYGYYAYDSAVADNKFKDNVFYTHYNSLMTYLCVLSLKNNNSSLVTNNYAIGGRYDAFYLYGYGATYDNFHVRNASYSYPSSTTYAAIGLAGGANVVLQNCTVNASRGHAIAIISGVFNYKIKNCSFGNIYANGASGDVSLHTTGAFSTAIFDSCDLSSSGGWYYYSADNYGYMYNANGSQYAFQNYDNSSGDHRIYKPDGVIQRTAAGLTDTTVRTTGGSCLRFASNNTTNNLTWEQNVPVGDVTAQTMTVGVWVKINSATYYAGTNQMPRLTVDYDNGTTTYAEAAQTAGSWQFLSIPITATTSYPQFKVTLSTNTDATSTDAYVYFTDFAVLYPAGYQLKLGELAYFADGEPLKPTIATNLSAADVWAVSTSGLTGTGTIGKFVTKLLTVAKFLGLK